MGPYSSLSERLELIARMFIPYSVLALIFILSIIAVPYPLAAILHAPLILMAVYYWSIYRPTILPPLLVFAIGLVYDIISGAPYLGLNALLFLGARFVVIDQRRFLTGQGFLIVWLGFCILAALYYMLQWSVVSLISWHMMDAAGTISNLIIGAVTFPMIYILLHISAKILPAPIIRSKNRLNR